MSKPYEENEKVYDRPHRRYSPSLFGPLVLIAIGIYFLLYNLGYVSGLNWWGALQLWPLLLIFLGLNVIVSQAPRPLGTLLSGLVGFLAIGVFGYVLLFGANDHPLLSRLRFSGDAELQREQIAFPAGDVTSAVMDLHFGLPSAQVYALDDSANLIEGVVIYQGDLVFETDVSNRQATIRLDTGRGGTWFFNPANWRNFSGEDRWRIGLNPNVETNLHLNVSAGSLEADLSQLALNRLEVDGGPGSMRLTLPDGNYDVFVDVSAGSTQMTLPASGRQTIEIDGGPGSLAVYLPASMAARVEVDGGPGSFNVDGRRFTQISGDRRDGVWQTAGYENAVDRVDLKIDVSAGSVTIREQ